MYAIMKRSPAIAQFIEYSNNALVILIAVLAVAGVVAIFNKKIRGKPALSAFCAAALAAFALEATACNFLSYLRYFAGPQTGIVGVSETDPNLLRTTDGARAEITENGIRFPGLDRKVTSVFVDVDFSEIETAEMTVKWTDEGITQEYKKTLYKYLPRENYAPLQPCGNVSELTITFTSPVDVNEVVVNKPIPFYFSGLRLLVVSLLIFAAFTIVNKNLRAKAAYWLFEYKFDPKNLKQNLVYAGAVVSLILFSWVCVFTSIKNWDEDKKRYHIYDECLVDALIDGRTYLDCGNPQLLLGAARPYDHTWRIANGYKETANEEAWDWSWYKGKYYCYFGVVPAALLFVPYKLITGNYLSNQVGTFIFCATAVILLALLWRYCVRKYMPDARFAFHILSFLTLFFASGTFALLRYPLVYCIVNSAGFMFVVAGVLLLLKSAGNEKINRPALFSACLCLALVFGCRPNMGLASLLVPVVLWRHRTWKLAAFAMLPYIIVAIPLCWYNYVRFGSIFDFGANYQLTSMNMKAFAQQNVLSKFFKIFISSAHYLFSPNQFSLQFPFVKPSFGGGEQISSGILWYYPNATGLVNFPIVFSLFYIVRNIFNKNKPKTFYVLSASLIIGCAITALNSLMSGCAGRYMADFAIFIILPSLFCAYYWCQESVDYRGNIGDASTFVGYKIRLRLTYALTVVSVFVGLFLSVSGMNSYSNPTLYRYLEISLGFFGIK